MQHSRSGSKSSNQRTGAPSRSRSLRSEEIACRLATSTSDLWALHVQSWALNIFIFYVRFIYNDLYGFMKKIRNFLHIKKERTQSNTTPNSQKDVHMTWHLPQTRLQNGSSTLALPSLGGFPLFAKASHRSLCERRQ